MFKVKDMWDLHIFQCDILCGAFDHRFEAWLKGAGVRTEKNSVIAMITSISPVMGEFQEGGRQLLTTNGCNYLSHKK